MTEHTYDTTFLQLTSVVRFAKSLGWEFNGRSFTKVNNHSKMVFCSFNNMQEIHNTESFYESWNGHICPTGGLKELRYTCSEGKIVQTSKLQYHKKLKQFVAQKHKVEIL